MTTLRCRGVLFDLDGVLVDSRPVVERTWRRWTQRHGLHVPDLVQRAHGRRSVDTVREIAPALDIDAEVAWLAAAELSDTAGLTALPGALSVFNAVPDERRAVVTSGGRDLALLRLQHVGFPVPGVLVAAEDVSAGKPAPDGYRFAAARLGFTPADCVVMEDTPPGIAAGVASGARVLAVATTFPREQLGDAEAVVPSLASIHIAADGADLRLTVQTER